MSSDREEEFVKRLFEQFTYEEIENIARAVNANPDEKLFNDDDDDGLEGDGEDIDLDDEEMGDISKMTLEEAQEVIRTMSPAEQEELANEILMKRAAKREWLGDQDDGYNQTPTAVLYGLHPKSDVGKRTIIHYRAWQDMIELARRRNAFTYDEAESVYEMDGGVRDAQRCKEAAAKLLKWCARFSDDDTVAFGAECIRDLPEFRKYRVLAADEEQDDDWCHCHVASVRKFAAFLDQCGGFVFP